MIEHDKSTFDITLESEIITINSDGYELFIVDAKMRAYEIKDGDTPVRATGLPDGMKIKDISCSYRFTVFLTKCGRMLVMDGI